MGSLTLLIIVLWFIKRNEENTYSKIWAFILGLNVQIISLLFIIGKQPGHRYLLSIASVLPLYILALYDLTKNNQVLSKVLFSTISISLSAFFIVNLTTSLNNHNDKVDYLSDYQDEITNFVVDYSEEKQISPDQVTIYWTYGTYSHCYSLWFGNDFSKSRFTDEIIDVCPNELQFDVWDQSITGTKDRGIEVLTEQQEYSIMIGRERYLEKYDGDAFIVNSNVKNLSFIYFR